MGWLQPHGDVPQAESLSPLPFADPKPMGRMIRAADREGASSSPALDLGDFPRKEMRGWRGTPPPFPRFPPSESQHFIISLPETI